MAAISGFPGQDNSHELRVYLGAYARPTPTERITMPELPYALGCPSCDHHVVVSEADPDASLAEMGSHIRWFHVRGAQSEEWAAILLAKVRDLTEAEVAVR